MMRRLLGRWLLPGLAVVAAGAMPAGAYVAGDGKGKVEADCRIGLEGYEAGDLSPFGKKAKLAVQCTDCDPACDLDGVPEPNGSCVFPIAVRVNDPDVAACTPGPLAKVEATAKAKGTKVDFVTTFAPPLDGSSATSGFLDFAVPVRKFGTPRAKAGTGKVRLLAAKPKDKDTFLFVCNPAPEGTACPTSSTTTTTVSASTTTTTTTVPLCVWRIDGDFEIGEDFTYFVGSGNVVYAWLTGAENSLTLTASGACAGEFCVYRVGDASKEAISEAEMRATTNDVSDLTPLTCGPATGSEVFATDSTYVFVVTRLPSESARSRPD